jgi:hypothetical protein
LNRVLQAAFQWEGGHLHQFSVENRIWDDGSSGAFGPGAFSAGPAPEAESKTRLSQILVTVGDRLDYVYDLVTALADPARPDHTHLVEWYVEVYGGVPADFDPAQVDIEELDRAVKLVVG